MPSDENRLQVNSQKDLLPADFRVTPELEAALALMEDGPDALFLTGKAGTGKSTLVRYLRSVTTQQVVVVAPTGISALNVQGQTIHSFFRFAPGPVTKESIARVWNRQLYRAIDLLIIDEVSMVRADLLDGIDWFLRRNGRSPKKRFGGTRVLLVGDPYQLPPVVSSTAERAFLEDRYGDEFFFSADCYTEAPHRIELKTIFRQSDSAFIHVLNSIRDRSLDTRDLDLLHTRLNEQFEPPEDETWVTLVPTNHRADQINKQRLEVLRGTEKLYEARLTGEFLNTDQRPLAYTELRLKTGAQVMFIKNDTGRRWVNGTMGIVKKLRADSVDVELLLAGMPKTVEVPFETWTMQRYTYDSSAKTICAEVVGTFEQIPLVPAWAVTIHKAQGKTFDRAIVDLDNGVFAAGQLYVALSRCRSLDGLVLRRRLSEADAIVNPSVSRFMLQN